MFSEEFMRYLINYQKPEFKDLKEEKTTTIPFKHNRNRNLATVLVNAKK